MDAPDKEPVFIQDYAALLAAIGPTEFNARYGRRPVLIGLHLVAAELAPAPKSKESMYSTMTMQPIAQDSVRTESLVGRVFWLNRRPGSRPTTRLVVGRFSDRDIMIPDHSISREHCAFIVEQDRVKITDCGSSNGTKVNSQELKKDEFVRLITDELITIGRVHFRYLSPTRFIDTLTVLGQTADS